MSVVDSEVTACRPSRGAAPAIRYDGAVAGRPPPRVVLASCDVRIDEFGELTPISRRGGQGRVYRPARVPLGLGTGPVVVKLYRRPPPAAATEILAGMVSWSRGLDQDQRARLHGMTAWPLRVVSAGGLPLGIVMQDVSGRFSVPFVMPSGRSEHVLLALEHLLCSDRYLHSRGLDVALDTVARARVAERVSSALAFLHRHAVVASDIAPSNVLVRLRGARAEVCLIDCDSMVFRGRQALESVETGDWDVPASFGEPPRTRATDAYKLGLVILRLFARSHDARTVAPHLRHVPTELRDLLYRALAGDRANRPPAGEWQLVLGKLLATGQLNDRYPGPTPPPVSQRQHVPVAPLSSRGASRLSSGVAPRSARGGASRSASGGASRLSSGVAPRSARGGASRWRSPLAPSIAASRPAASVVPARRPVQASRLRMAVVLLWLVALAVIAALVFSRLLAIAAPSQDVTGFGSGFQGIAPQRTPYYQYYGPPSGAQGIPYVPYQ